MSTKEDAVQFALEDIRDGRYSVGEAIGLAFETGRVSAASAILQADDTNSAISLIALQAAMAVAEQEARG